MNTKGRSLCPVWLRYCMNYYNRCEAPMFVMHRLLNLSSLERKHANDTEKKGEVLNAVQSVELLSHLLAKLHFPSLLLNCCANSKMWGSKRLYEKPLFYSKLCPESKREVWPNTVLWTQSSRFLTFQKFIQWRARSSSPLHCAANYAKRSLSSVRLES